jgi:hypothetical protein
VLAYHKWVAADAQSRGEHSAKLVCISRVEVDAFYETMPSKPDMLFTFSFRLLTASSFYYSLGLAIPLR